MIGVLNQRARSLRHDTEINAFVHIQLFGSLFSIIVLRT